MLIPINPTTLVNVNAIEYVQKLTDSKCAIHFTSGNSIYVHKTVREVLSALGSDSFQQLLNETCA